MALSRPDITDIAQPFLILVSPLCLRSRQIRFTVFGPAQGWTCRRSRPESAVWAEFESELGGDRHLLTEGSKGFAHELLIRERTVYFGGVEEGDAPFDGFANQRDRLLLVCCRTVAKARRLLSLRAFL